MEPALLTHRSEPRGVKLHLVVLHEAESVTVFKLDVRLLLQLFFSSGFFVRVKLQPGGNWEVVCDTKEMTKFRHRDRLLAKYPTSSTKVCPVVNEMLC